jgi:hypothetical protein
MHSVIMIFLFNGYGLKQDLGEGECLGSLTQCPFEITKLSLGASVGLARGQSNVLPNERASGEV